VDYLQTTLLVLAFMIIVTGRAWNVRSLSGYIRNSVWAVRHVRWIGCTEC